ncbi:MAG: amidase [Alphaproteobacteria bacterium]|nr:amidase [Alphaproteobacteria bacterium]
MAFKEYDRYDALGLAALVRDRKVSVGEVLEAAIARIEALDPRLNAVSHRQFDRARREAQLGLPQGPFHGVPFLLKDLYALDAGEPSGNGSRLYDGFLADHNSEIVTRFRNAGLAVLGRSNSPELGLVPTTEPVRFGPTRNPWAPDRSSGGSSGGSAAAVAARMVPIAHATDGGGSIRIPASACGVVGLKPSRARCPMGPDVGEGWNGLAVGLVVSRSVRDMAAALDAVEGASVGDPYACPPKARPFLSEVGAPAGRLRIALSTAAPAGVTVHPDCVAAAQDAAKLCAGLGHVVEEADPPVDHEALWDAFATIIASHVANTINLREKALGRKARPEEVERATWGFAEAGRTQVTGADYARAILTVHTLGRRMGTFMERFDVLLTPTLAQPPLPLGAIDMMDMDQERYRANLRAFIPFTPIENAAGLPAISLPLAWNGDGLPIGSHFVGRYADEATLLRLAAQLETARPWHDRRPPVS